MNFPRYKGLLVNIYTEKCDPWVVFLIQPALLAIEALIDDARREYVQEMRVSLHMLIEFGVRPCLSTSDAKILFLTKANR